MKSCNMNKWRHCRCKTLMARKKSDTNIRHRWLQKIHPHCIFVSFVFLLFSFQNRFTTHLQHTWCVRHIILSRLRFTARENKEKLKVFRVRFGWNFRIIFIFFLIYLTVNSVHSTIFVEYLQFFFRGRGVTSIPFLLLPFIYPFRRLSVQSPAPKEAQFFFNTTK